MLRITFTYFVGGDCDLGDLFEAAVQFGTDPGKDLCGDIAVFAHLGNGGCGQASGEAEVFFGHFSVDKEFPQGFERDGHFASAPSLGCGS